jgi:hypothetical protein
MTAVSISVLLVAVMCHLTPARAQQQTVQGLQGSSVSQQQCQEQQSLGSPVSFKSASAWALQSTGATWLTECPDLFMRRCGSRPFPISTRARHLESLGTTVGGCGTESSNSMRMGHQDCNEIPRTAARFQGTHQCSHPWQLHARHRMMQQHWQAGSWQLSAPSLLSARQGSQWMPQAARSTGK